ncbi:hypothetical protein BJ742DRAFT_572489 [Cladochytrium replicatum]|nr:hypothetical protein BJ742DRAFT_572489 [Cladochytrium replicatum]
MSALILPSLNGKVAIVTGSNQGIGLETAKTLYLNGAHVFVVGRSEAKLKKALETILAAARELSEKPDKQKLEYLICDLAKFDDVRTIAASFLSRNLPLDILVLNAGIIATNDQTYAPDGFDYTVTVNHLSQFYLTQLLLPAMEKATSDKRIVVVSSDMAVLPRNLDWPTVAAVTRPGFTRYSDTKLMNVLFARALSRRLRSRNYYVNACHPGSSFDPNIDVSDAASFDLPPGFTMIDMIWAAFFNAPFGVGAQSEIYAAASGEVVEMDVRGQLIGPRTTGFLFRRPRQTDLCALPRLVSDEREEEMFKWSIELIKQKVH